MNKNLLNSRTTIKVVFMLVFPIIFLNILRPSATLGSPKVRRHLLAQIQEKPQLLSLNDLLKFEVSGDDFSIDLLFTLRRRSMNWKYLGQISSRRLFNRKDGQETIIFDQNNYTLTYLIDKKHSSHFLQILQQMQNSNFKKVKTKSLIESESGVRTKETSYVNSDFIIIAQAVYFKGSTTPGYQLQIIKNQIKDSATEVTKSSFKYFQLENYLKLIKEDALPFEKIKAYLSGVSNQKWDIDFFKNNELISSKRYPDFDMLYEPKYQRLMVETTKDDVYQGLLKELDSAQYFKTINKVHASEISNTTYNNDDTEIVCSVSQGGSMGNTNYTITFRRLPKHSQ